MIELVMRNYWYLGVIRDIGKYVEQNGDTSKEVEVEKNSKEAIDSSNSGLHYLVAVSSYEEYNLSDMQQAIKDNIFYNNNKETIDKGISMVVQR